MNQLKSTDSKEVEQYIKEATSEKIETLWGSELTFSPVMVDEIIGDGLQFLYWGTIDQRPYYWILRIDSKTDIDADDFNTQDELLLMVTDQFGEYDPYDEGKEDEPTYPTVINTMGTHWGVLKNFNNEQ